MSAIQFSKDPETQKRLEQIITTPSRKIVWDCICNGFGLAEAAKEAHLSHRYVRKWVAESGANSLALRETAVKTEDLRSEVSARLMGIVRNSKAADRDVIKATDVLGKMNGWHSQTTVLEAGSRQKQLTEAEREEARKLAELRFKPEYSLPEPVVGQEAVFEPRAELDGVSDLRPLAEPTVDDHAEAENGQCEVKAE